MNKFSTINLSAIIMGFLALSVSAANSGEQRVLLPNDLTPMAIHLNARPAPTPKTEAEARSTLQALKRWVDELNQTIYSIKIRDGVTKNVRISLKLNPLARDWAWSMERVKEQPEYFSNTIIFLGHINDESFSLQRAVNNNISNLNGAEMTPIEAPAKARRSFQKHPEYGIPHQFIKMKRQILEQLKTWMKNEYDSNESLRAQEFFPLVIYQSGILAEEYAACRKTLWDEDTQKFFSTREGHSPEITHKRRTELAFNDYLDKINKTVYFKLNGIVKTLKIELKFLHNRDESQLSGTDFFESNWAKNSKILEEIAATTGVGDFNNIYGFIAVNIGYLTSEMYYVSDGGLVFKQFNFGVGGGYTDEKIRDLLKLLKSKNKPVVFFNAISNAKAVNKPVADKSILSLNGRTRCVPDEVGSFANLLMEQNQAVELDKAYIYLFTNKAFKLLNKWTNALAKNLSQFEPGKVNFISDFGGRSFSVKPVIGQVVRDLDDLISEYWPGVDKYGDEQAIVDWFMNPPPHGVNMMLERYMDYIVVAILKYLNKNYHDRQISAQDQYHLVIRQTGKLRKLNIENKEWIDIFKATREAEIEEKKR